MVWEADEQVTVFAVRMCGDQKQFRMPYVICSASIVPMEGVTLLFPGSRRRR